MRRNQYAPYLGLACALHDFISVAVELLQVEMAVRISQHYAARPLAASALETRQL